MDKTYFETKENENWKLLCEFNEHTNLFDEIGRMHEYYHSDATGQTTNKLGETKTHCILKAIRLLTYC